jgi:hypothetical protein
MAIRQIALFLREKWAKKEKTEKNISVSEKVVDNMKRI